MKRLQAAKSKNTTRKSTLIFLVGLNIFLLLAILLVLLTLILPRQSIQTFLFGKNIAVDKNNQVKNETKDFKLLITQKEGIVLFSWDKSFRVTSLALIDTEKTTQKLIPENSLLFVLSNKNPESLKQETLLKVLPNPYTLFKVPNGFFILKGKDSLKLEKNKKYTISVQVIDDNNKILTETKDFVYK